jgi:hypothetical protein
MCVLTIFILLFCLSFFSFVRWQRSDDEVAEREKGKHFFTRKEVKYPGSRRSNRVAGNGFWRAAGSEVPIYYKPEGAADDMLVGMRRTLVFHYGKSRSAERTEWAMHEFQLAGAGLLPHPMMRRATSNGSEPPCGCLEATFAKVRCYLQKFYCSIYHDSI